MNECEPKRGSRLVPTVVGAAVLLGGTALASRLLGLIRDRMLASTFGAGVQLDAYYAAFRIPDLVYTFLVLGALSAGFIPFFTERYRAKKDAKGAWLFTNHVLNIMGVLLVVLSVVGIVLTPWLMRVVAPGFDLEAMQLAVDLSRVMYLSTILLGLSSVFGGVLQGLKRFTLYAIAPLLYNIGIIVGTMIALWTDGGIMAVAWGVVAGAAAHMLLQLIGALSSGWRYKLTANWRDPDVRNMFQMMGPRVVGLAVSQVNLIAMTAIASVLAAGSVTMFNFANNIQYVPIGIVGISFAIAAFPSLTELAAKKKTGELVATISETTRNILYLIVPASVVFLLLRAQIVRVVLGADGFGWNETIITADALAFFVLSLFAQSLVPLFVRVFFAWKNTLLPALVAILTAIVNITLSWFWSQQFGVVGIAMGFSAASILQCVLLWVLMRIRLREMDELRILRSLTIIVASAVVSGLMIQAMKILYERAIDLTTFWGVLGQGLVAGIAGLATYAAMSWALKSEEYATLVCSLRRKLFKGYRFGESGDEAVDVQF